MNESILVVEDHPTELLAVVDVLGEAGFEVLYATDAEAALEIVDSGKRIDLLFTDVQLPGKMDGLDLAAVLKLRRVCGAVIYSTGSAYDPPRMVSPSLLLRKPYSHVSLLQAVRGSIDLAAQS